MWKAAASGDVIDDFLTDGGGNRSNLHGVVYALVRAIYDSAESTDESLPRRVPKPSISRISRQGPNYRCGWHVVISAIRWVLGTQAFQGEEHECRLAHTVAGVFKQLWLGAPRKLNGE